MQRYDPLSGQVYTEKIVKRLPRSTYTSGPLRERRNERRTPYETQLEAERLKHQGVESLHAKAMRKLIANARSLTPEALRATPAPIVMQIWKAIIRENRVTLSLWRAFTNSGHADSTFVHSPKMRRLEGPHVVDTFNAITSPNLAWVTTLTLDSFLGNASDLKQVTRIVNLRSLEVRHTFPDVHTAFDDGIVEYWAMRAGPALGEPFSVLRSLVIIGAPRITASSFPNFQRFPSLQTLVLSETSVKRNHRNFASKRDWRIDTNGPYASIVKARITSSRGKAQFDLRDITRDYVYSLRSSSSSSSSSSMESPLSKDENAPAARLNSLPLLSMHFSGGRNARVNGKSILGDVLCFERREAGTAVSQSLEAAHGEQADEGSDDAGFFMFRGLPIFAGKKIKFEDEPEVKEMNEGTKKVESPVFQGNKIKFDAESEVREVNEGPKDVALPVFKKRKIRSGKEKELESALSTMLSGGVSAGLGIFPTRED